MKKLFLAISNVKWTHVSLLRSTRTTRVNSTGPHHSNHFSNQHDLFLEKFHLRGKILCYHAPFYSPLVVHCADYEVDGA